MNKRRSRMALVALGALALSILGAACTQEASAVPAPTGSSAPEVVETSYLDIVGTITEARARVTDWTKGDEKAIPLAQERLKRVDTLIARVGWPVEMAGAIAKTKVGSAEMAKVLLNKDTAGAETASAYFGDGSHDITHSFYGDWLPAMKGAQASPMAAHAGYLDLTLNVADLRARVNLWDKGDESAIGVAKEKTERTGIVAGRMLDYGLVTGSLKAINRELPFMAAALERKDLAVAKQTLAAIEANLNEVSRGFDSWLSLAAGSNDPACLQASYLEVQRRSAAIQSNIASWRKGDEGSLGVAQAELTRLGAALSQPVWGEQLGATMERVKANTGALGQALGSKDQAGAEAAGKALAESAYYAQTAYYAYWLPTGVLITTAQTTGAQAAAGGHGDGHGGATTATAATPAANPGPNWAVIGGFGAIMATVVGAAWVLKRSMVADTGSRNEEPAAV